MLSRVADSMYWLSRYLERAEHTARVLDVNLNLMLDQQSAAANQARLGRLLTALHSPMPPGMTAETLDVYSLTDSLTFDLSNPNSIMACIISARENARQVREQISSEMWEQLNQLFLNLKTTTLNKIWNTQPWEFFRSIKEGSQLFQGITNSTMNHGEGWLFIEVGRFIERAVETAAMLDTHFIEFGHRYGEVELAADEYIEWLGLLRSCTAFEGYCKVYTAEVRPRRIAEFLLLNSEFPHALRFAIDMVHSALATIDGATETHKSGRVNRLAGRLKASLSFGQIDEIVGEGMHSYLLDIQRQCAELHTAIRQTYIAYPVDVALSA